MLVKKPLRDGEAAFFVGAFRMSMLASGQWLLGAVFFNTTPKVIMLAETPNSTTLRPTAIATGKPEKYARKPMAIQRGTAQMATTSVVMRGNMMLSLRVRIDAHSLVLYGWFCKHADGFASRMVSAIDAADVVFLVLEKSGLSFWRRVGAIVRLP
ncbi:Hypothetical protein HDN1F_13110 [gamma proteobacterium HdN1]|nr:Hypothetical protein HDN1F_13110 [gamma proteobacterium HdN1]